MLVLSDSLARLLQNAFNSLPNYKDFSQNKKKMFDIVCIEVSPVLWIKIEFLNQDSQLII